MKIKLKIEFEENKFVNIILGSGHITQIDPNEFWAFIRSHRQHPITIELKNIIMFMRNIGKLKTLNENIIKLENEQTKLLNKLTN